MYASALAFLLIDILLPPVCIADGLPPHGEAAANAQLANRADGEFKALSNRLWGSDENAALTAWFHSHECELRAKMWRLVARAGTPGDVIDRRQALAELVKLVGWRAVLTGELPPPVPLEAIPIR